MAKIQVLDSKTIDQIAAGEVVERPASVVKELVENACDAGADAVTVEIRDGGISFIRVTDNGSGIESSQVRMAFCRHATSKIRDVSDLGQLQSMGFRGEALSSIAAVSMVEIITKTKEALTGVRYCLEGEKEIEFSQVGAPDGTTILVRDLFFNTPARKKFLRTAATEGSYVADVMEHIALARPDVSFQLLINRQPRFSTSGSGDLKEAVYRIYGRQIAREMFPFCAQQEGMQVEGFLGNVQMARPNRNFEFFFVNRRYIKSQVLSRGLEGGYATRLMQHKFPMACLHFTVDTHQVDVNVHPSKMEVRFSDNQRILDFLEKEVKRALLEREMIPEVTETEENRKAPVRKDELPQKTEAPMMQEDDKDSAAALARKLLSQPAGTTRPSLPQPFEKNRLTQTLRESKLEYDRQEKLESGQQQGRQENLFEEKLLSEKAVAQYELIGQIFDTYWIASYRDKMLLIDQHAAHEKVKYEALIRDLKQGNVASQNLMPPVVVTLSRAEEDALTRYADCLAQAGFEVEPFGGSSWALRSVPCDLYGCRADQLLEEILSDLAQDEKPGPPAAVLERIATMACKAAVKGGQRMEKKEMEELLRRLLELENPYQCPHGRPTMITMSRQELERKFRRIV